MTKKSAEKKTVDPAQLDVGHLALFVGYAFSDQVEKSLASAFPKLRFSWGFVFQRLLTGEQSIGELAEAMQVTQQAASKTVKELLAEGLVETAADAADARVRRVRLSRRGMGLIRAARRARKQLVNKLTARLGAQKLDEIQALLTELLELLGGADAVRRRRVIQPS